MDNDLIVLGLLESVLGRGKRDRKSSDYMFNCPICSHKKPKLVINVTSGQYNCFTCSPPTKGVTPVSLFKKLNVDKIRLSEMASYFPANRIKLEVDTERNEFVTLPKEYISLLNNDGSLEYRQALAYLKQRKVTNEDIKKYSLGYCKDGRYRNRIIVPSYGESGNLQYFIARSFVQDAYLKYDAPSVKKDQVIGMEYFINWNIPIVLCEGAFDAIAIKRNVIPLFGKTISNALMKKLVQSEVKTIYLALDNDAIKQSIHYAEKLLEYGKEIYVMELEGKDPSNIGFENMTKLFQNAKPFTFSDLIIKKMEHK
jgi:DNA primase